MGNLAKITSSSADFTMVVVQTDGIIHNSETTEMTSNNFNGLTYFTLKVDWKKVMELSQFYEPPYNHVCFGLQALLITLAASRLKLLRKSDIKKVPISELQHTMLDYINFPKQDVTSREKNMKLCRKGWLYWKVLRDHKVCSFDLNTVHEDPMKYVPPRTTDTSVRMLLDEALIKVIKNKVARPGKLLIGKVVMLSERDIGPVGSNLEVAFYIADHKVFPKTATCKKRTRLTLVPTELIDWEKLTTAGLSLSFFVLLRAGVSSTPTRLSEVNPITTKAINLPFSVNLLQYLWNVARRCNKNSQ